MSSTGTKTSTARKISVADLTKLEDGADLYKKFDSFAKKYTRRVKAAGLIASECITGNFNTLECFIPKDERGRALKPPEGMTREDLLATRRRDAAPLLSTHRPRETR